MPLANYDFSGWATRNDLKCSDGRTIRQNAFVDDNGKKVPLVWNHQHNSHENVLGHAILENRNEGVYAYGYFNDTAEGQRARTLVQHGDIEALSIYANKLKQTPQHDVVHGCIREVSLVMAGANPGAFIDDVVIRHSDGSISDPLEDEVVVYTGEKIELFHADTDKEEPLNDEKTKKETEMADEQNKKPESEETFQDVIDTMNEKQQKVMYALIGMVAEQNEGSDKEEEMKHNAFDDAGTVENNYLSHADEGEILTLARETGSLKTAMKAWSAEHDVTLAHGDVNGFENVDTLFPEFKNIRPGAPEIIDNDYTWVDLVMSKTQKVPFANIRTQQVDIREIDDLAKGYKKGDKKKITGTYKLARRETGPQTIYVRSQLNRDDVIDIDDFDYVDYQYKLDSKQLKKTLAIATLLGDGRDDTAEDKISGEHIRPIWTDDELFTIHTDIDIAAMKKELQGTDTSVYFGDNFVYSEAMVNTIVFAREDFRGTGRGDFFADPAVIDKMMLARDRNGYRLYKTESELATALGVASVNRVVEFKNKVRKDEDGNSHKLLGIVVNFNDYAYGMNKGGDVTSFNEFDIDFNQFKSLMETRKSGALTRIKSAIVIEEAVAQG